MIGGALIALVFVIGGLGLAVRRLSANQETNAEAARRAGVLGAELPIVRVVRGLDPHH
ncbi:MAG TPA: hypothetical protein VML75_21550 [Kofleriaceae bacterium]|nr:hypothetical protein [Kofleriaceae bacterium]